MVMGINNITSVTYENLTKIGNFTDPAEFYINVNNIVYGGIFFFVILWVLTVITFLALNRSQKQPLVNAMYALTITSIISLFFRAWFVVRNGVYYGMITDYQLWIFPILAISLATYLYATREE